jgi:hypothetical protein
MDKKSFIIFGDGGSRGNPGEAAYGFAVFDEKEVLFLQRVMEWRWVLLVLLILVLLLRDLLLVDP